MGGGEVTLVAAAARTGEERLSAEGVKRRGGRCRLSRVCLTCCALHCHATPTAHGLFERATDGRVKRPARPTPAVSFDLPDVLGGLARP